MSASPEMHHQHQQLQQDAGAPLAGEMKSNSAEGTPPPELATMTTVSVLDLHKDINGMAGGTGAGSGSGSAPGTGTVTSPHIVHDGATDMSLPDDGTTEKVYDKETNTVYVYTTVAGAAGHKMAPNAHQHHHHQLTTIVHGQQQQQQMSSPEHLHPNEHHSSVADQNLLHARLIQQQSTEEQQQQHLQRMSPVDQHHQQHQQHVHPDDGGIIDGHRLLPATINGNDAGAPDQQQQQHHQQHPHHLGRLSPEEQEQQQAGVRLLEDSHIQRLLGNQEIISRDIINGEHHIITRNENGETILTRIAISTADQLLNRMDNSIIYTTTGGAGGGTGAVGGQPEQLPTTVLQYEKDVEDKHQQPQHGHGGHAHAGHQPIYAAAHGATSDPAQTKQIVYTLGGGEPKNVIYGDPKAAMPHFEPVPGAGTGGGGGGGGGGSGGGTSGGSGSGEDEKPQIDYVYNEGNKTVIYTDQKGLESLYANNELGLIDGTQIVVQGNLHYTQQPGPDGTTVYVVSSDMNPEDINGLQQR
uniref:Uncharacterized protein n=1 Tax=Anopheles dirus TaxID=7168 RepID=A0A182NLP3_9DIPT